jgi:hypothetical protein
VAMNSSRGRLLAFGIRGKYVLVSLPVLCRLARNFVLGPEH